ncbi:MAG TPA: hypothetical protein VGV41_22100 [Pseudolabrys sp.]|uniref:hypothetical protein n=1 Tax=Pseudolabrys sp. TaxID=1960880 RepID=UPI002DDDBBBF|nr:hypothetical protein [Pseudolabrys sp.]HEV2631325.1 hypothetical protein [Pseudolabrys sp.]
MGVWKVFLNKRKWDHDPVQRRLAELIIEGAQGPMGSVVIRTFVLDQNWSASEETDRLAHAVTLVRAQRPDLYHEAAQIAGEFIAWSSAD